MMHVLFEYSASRETSAVRPSSHFKFQVICKKSEKCLRGEQEWYDQDAYGKFYEGIINPECLYEHSAKSSLQLSKQECL